MHASAKGFMLFGENNQNSTLKEFDSESPSAWTQCWSNSAYGKTKNSEDGCVVGSLRVWEPYSSRGWVQG